MFKVILSIVKDFALEILYHDDYLIAINKPHGLLVHRSKRANDATTFAVQTLRNQIGKRVHPMHRLDRKTSGVLLFSFDAETTRHLQSQFLDHSIAKEYVAIVRGYFPDVVSLDYPLVDDRGVEQSATTDFRCLEQFEIDIPFGKWPTSRYSLVEAIPTSGRTHQIRRHLAHLRHPIIGDRPHGCNKQNKLWKEKWNMTTMLLHAQKLTLRHPVSMEQISLKATRSNVFQQVHAQLSEGVISVIN